MTGCNSLKGRRSRISQLEAVEGGPYKAANPSPPVTPPASEFSRMLSSLIYRPIAVLILAVIIWGVSGQGGFLGSLSDRAVARGLITFLGKLS